MNGARTFCVRVCVCVCMHVFSFSCTSYPDPVSGTCASEFHDASYPGPRAPLDDYARWTFNDHVAGSCRASCLRYCRAELLRRPDESRAAILATFHFPQTTISLRSESSIYIYICMSHPKVFRPGTKVRIRKNTCSRKDLQAMWMT